MKKLALILAVLLLFGGVAFASDVTISGAVTNSFGFGEDGYVAGRNRANMNVNAQVDAVNSLSITFEYNGGAADSGFVQGSNAPTINNAHFTTNLGAALGLDGQTLTTRIGWYEASGFVVGNVSGTNAERLRQANRARNVQLDYAFGSVFQLRTLVQPGDGAAMNGLVSAAGGVGPVRVSVTYSDFASEDGNLEVGLLFSDNLVPGTLALQVGANLDVDLAADNDAISWGVGVNAGLLDGLATVGVGFNGDENNAVDQMAVKLNVAPVAFAGFDVLAGLGLGDSYTDALTYFEASAYLRPGAATYRIGYALKGADVYNPGGETNTGAAPGQDSGHVFFAASLSF